MADTKPKSDMVTIKDFFAMSAKDAIAETKKLTAEDKKQLADGIRSGSLTY